MTARVVIRREAQPARGGDDGSPVPTDGGARGSGTGAAAEACRPDLEQGPEGTAAAIEGNADGALTLTVRARDISSLRAALNAHLRCLALALDVGAGASTAERKKTV